MDEINKWIDQVGKEVKVGDFICYAIARAWLTFGIVSGFKNKKIQIKRVEWQPRYELNGYQPTDDGYWQIHISLLQNAPKLVLPINMFQKFPNSVKDNNSEFAWRKLYGEINEQAQAKG